jgi:hypothetical protein
MLTINSADRGNIRVIIDGHRFEPNDNFMRIQSIEAGYHNVKIYRERNTGLFRIFGKMYEVVFSNSINIKPRTNLMILVDRFGRTTVQQTRMNGNIGRDGRGFGGHNDRNFGDGTDRNWDSNHEFEFDRSKNQGDYNNDRDGRFDGNDRDGRNGQFDGRGDRGYNDNNYNKALNDFEFNRILVSIDKEWSENNKVKSATQVISTNYFTAVQVKQMLQLFSMENTKLDLAKQAYSKTVDPINYFILNDVFSSNNSKDELARFIRNH